MAESGHVAKEQRRSWRRESDAGEEKAEDRADENEIHVTALGKDNDMRRAKRGKIAGNRG